MGGRTSADRLRARAVHPLVRVERVRVLHSDSPRLVDVNILSIGALYKHEMFQSQVRPSAPAVRGDLCQTSSYRVRTGTEPNGNGADDDRRAQVILRADRTITRGAEIIIMHGAAVVICPMKLIRRRTYSRRGKGLDTLRDMIAKIFHNK